MGKQFKLNNKTKHKTKHKTTQLYTRRMQTTKYININILKEPQKRKNIAKHKTQDTTQQN